MGRNETCPLGRSSGVRNGSPAVPSGIQSLYRSSVVESMQGIFGQLLKTICDVCSSRAVHLKITWRNRGKAVPVAEGWHMADIDGIQPVAAERTRQIPIFSREESRCSGEGFPSGGGDPRSAEESRCRVAGFMSDCSDLRDFSFPIFEARTGGVVSDQGGEPEQPLRSRSIEVLRNWRLRIDTDRNRCRFDGAVGDFSVVLRIAFPKGGNGLFQKYLRRVVTLLDFLEACIEVLGPPGTGGYMPASDSAPPLSPALLGESKEMKEIRETVRIAARCNIPLLVEGESGTGKEIVARNSHGLGPRQSGPIVIINCLEVPASLLQSELFGHVKGSFTGASRDRIGLIESAAGGTLFLDEIGEMPMSLQAALLRILQEKEVRRIGESRRRKIDVRFVFATNRDLRGLVEKGEFRRDLFYRICGMRIHLPSLRDRREDIPILARHFLALAAGECGERSPHITARAVGRLLSYDWPGNVRELKNEMERIFAFHPGARYVRPEMLSSQLVSNEDAWNPDGRETLNQAVRRLESGMIKRALDRFGGNRTRAARHLGITRQGLLKKLKRYDIAEDRRAFPGR
jgi:DNA-binding NtrC family response regulator